ncbi:polysaccharide deacetylase family protein [Marinobacter pelagius]|uniref:polysaccharide deacetylase family protein n=1 Tax=Marinobacter sp. C7 TaxID=2951363 RepID=UPI001EEFAD9F|nr:polysaccharide deacetylase family protein [Marinobacter sp. C7]MCG7199466.1 polysaccharide deacetylase family protein [Marinobacter sp. C7]
MAASLTGPKRASSKQIFINLLTHSGLDRVARMFFPPIIPVFLLHRFEKPGVNVSGHDPNFVDEALTRLKKKGFTFISLDEAVQLKVVELERFRKLVAFTIDDGFADQIEIAAQIFSAHSCPLTCFVITDFLDGLSWPWDAKISWICNNVQMPCMNITLGKHKLELTFQTDEDCRTSSRVLRTIIKASLPMQAETLVESVIAQAGVEVPRSAPSGYEAIEWKRARELESPLIQYGAHSRTHQLLSSLNDEESEEEIAGSRRRLLEEVLNPSNVFCYPVGRFVDFTEREKALARKHGFVGAVSAEPGYFVKGKTAQDLFSLPRFGFPSNMADLLQCCTWVEYMKSRVFG